jgi:hypothetical protein
MWSVNREAMYFAELWDTSILDQGGHGISEN